MSSDHLTIPQKGFMTEQPLYIEVSTEKAWSRIGDDKWSQMAWFVKLANTTSFESMTRGEQLIWEEEFVAMYLRVYGPVIEVPQDRKGSLRSPEPNSPEIVVHLPSPAQMQEVRDSIAPQLEDLADDKGAIFGQFQVQFTISFYRNAGYDKDPKVPRYSIDRGETFKPTRNVYHRPLVLRTARLLEVYVDNIRRCKLCRNLFLQLKRSAKYCGPKCYTVGCMREFRANKSKKLGFKTSAKGVSRHGKTKR